VKDSRKQVQFLTFPGRMLISNLKDSLDVPRSDLSYDFQKGNRHNYRLTEGVARGITRSAGAPC